MTPGRTLEPTEGRTGNVRHATCYRAEEPVSDGGGGRQVVLVVRLRQEWQPAVLRWLASRQWFFPGRIQGGGIWHNPILRLQEQRQQATLRRNSPLPLRSPAKRRLAGDSRGAGPAF